jgi:hypothetical protein
VVRDYDPNSARILEIQISIAARFTHISKFPIQLPRALRNMAQAPIAWTHRIAVK